VPTYFLAAFIHRGIKERMRGRPRSNAAVPAIGLGACRMPSAFAAESGAPIA
jgi:hypothetical protein